MAGNIGTGDDPLSLLRTEQLRLEVRQSDPSSLESNETWLRDDLDGKSDKLGELRWNDEGTVKSVPVLAVGSSGSDITEARRVQLSGQTGFIPLASPSDASYSAFRAQVGGTTLAHHDAASIATAKIAFSARPDSIIKIFDISTEEITDTGVVGAPETISNINTTAQSRIVFRDPFNNDKIKTLDSSGAVTDTGENSASGEFVAADTDGDGVDEIPFVDFDTSVVKVHDLGEGTTVNTGESAFQIAAGDTDGDGVDEIAFIDADTQTITIRDPSDGTTSDTGVVANAALEVGDIDADGVGEIIFSGDSNSDIKIFDPDSGTTSNTGERSQTFVVGDTDGDGGREIIFKDLTTDEIKIHDPKDGTTINTGNDGAEPGGVDVDDDGKAEVTFVNSNLVNVYDPTSDTTSIPIGQEVFRYAVGVF